MADDRRREIGVIGAGRMGLPIIGHLVRKGMSVRVHDVDATRRDRVEALGATWVEPAALAQASPIVLVCVGYDHQVRQLLSAGGVLKLLQLDAIVAVLSTVQPGTVRALADLARPRGVHVVDATLCRGGRAADEGTLLAFVAGSADIADRLEPVLACFSTDIVRTGAIGTAQVAKAANNMLMWACLVANHEALALAKRSGMDVEILRQALLKTGADNDSLRHWGAQTMAWAEDDLDIVQAMARDAGLGLPQAGLNREICRTLKPRRFKLDEYGV